MSIRTVFELAKKEGAIWHPQPPGTGVIPSTKDAAHFDELLYVTLVFEPMVWLSFDASRGCILSMELQINDAKYH